jgi:hypothetical protein
MIVALEKCKLIEQELTATAGASEELKQQIAILKESIRAMEGLIALQKQKEEMYQNMLEMDKALMAAKDKSCREQIKAAKPTFFQELGKYSAGGVAGAIIVGVLLLL